jgi:hypothetical protein
MEVSLIDRARLWLSFKLLRLADVVAGGTAYRREPDEWEVWQ